jgi:hypothetical protein
MNKPEVISMPYDVGDVKSVQKFLGEMKEKFNSINSVLPEGAEKVDFDSFSESFFNANEGILKNRDALKTEKLALNTKLEETSKTLKEYEEKIGSIDETLPDKYNKTIEELNALKDSVKDGSVDIDVIKARHEAEKKKLEAEVAKSWEEKLNGALGEVDSYKNASETFQNLYFNTLKKDSLVDDLDRIKVNPEDRPLILQANLSRAEVAEDGEGGYAVFYRTDKGELVSGQEFWDKWAVSDHNQKYILAEENNGGGASGAPSKGNTLSKRDQLIKQLQESQDLKERLRLTEEISKLNKNSK